MSVTGTPKGMTCRHGDSTSCEFDSTCTWSLYHEQACCSLSWHDLPSDNLPHCYSVTYLQFKWPYAKVPPGIEGSGPING